MYLILTSTIFFLLAHSAQLHTQKLLHSFVTAGEPTHPVMTRNMFVFIHADIYNQEVMLKNIYIFKSKKVGSPIKHYPTYPSLYGRFYAVELFSYGPRRNDTP